MSRAQDFLNYLDSPLAADFTLAPEAALAYFAAKGLRTSFDWRDLIGADHVASFTVAKMMDTDLLADVHDSLLEAMATGKPFREWADGITPLLQAKGWWGRKAVTDPLTGRTIVAQLGSPGRLQTIYRTNMQQAYAAGAWAQIESQAQIAPYLLYDAIDDHRTRPEHAEWDGTVLPINHDWWRSHYPPCGWNCRCGVIQLSDDDLEAMGLAVSRPPAGGTYAWDNPRTGKTERVAKGVDPGFGGNPGAEHARRMAQLAIEKAKALPAELVKPALAGIEAAAKAAEVTADEVVALAFDASTPAGRWHVTAWNGTPDWLRQVVLRQQAVTVTTENSGAWAMGGNVVNMAKYSPESGKARDVWRHEFGHIIDVRMTGADPTAYHGRWSSGEVFTAAMQADAKALKAAAKGPKKGGAAALEATYDTVRDDLVDLSGQAARTDYLAERAKALGLDLVAFKDALRDNTTAIIDGLAGDVRVARMLLALEQRDAERFLFEAVGRDAVVESLGYDRVYYKAVREAWEAGGLGSLSDLVGAATRNAVASIKRGYSGHDEGYYRKRAGYGQQTEAFANLTALAGANSPVWWQIVRILTPEMATAYKRGIENGGI